MDKIDHRRHYILIVDTETANTMRDDSGRLDTSSTLVYDCGWAVMDTRGNIYRTRSFVNRDIFVYEQELMQSAYYASKIPIYLEGIADGSRVLADTYEIWRTMMDDMEEYGINEVCAHNARFDYNSLNTIKRWTTKSKFRYWFPYGTEIWDSMKMARSVIHNMPTYRKFCEEYGLLTANGRLSTTAENLYRFIIKDPYFEESHTGLEDVMIEAQIVAYCYRQHKAMKKKLFEKSA